MRFIDSHTGGEPTRVIVAGGPDLGAGSLAERVARCRQDFDDFRRTVILEPRGSDALVGALLCPPDDSSCATGVIFFNNSGYLGMCGHGAIGIAVTLHYLQRAPLGRLRLDTPVGPVEVELKTAHEVTIENVAAYRLQRDVAVAVDTPDGPQQIVGDIAWGGNWFFLVAAKQWVTIDEAFAAGDLPSLTAAAVAIRAGLRRAGITGEHGAEIDHIEFFGPPQSTAADSRNFVLCPGGAYDRSPCGTGTSAKLACLAADNQLSPSEAWVQESIIGSQFTASYEPLSDGKIRPTITGTAFICGEGTLICQQDDPFATGISTWIPSANATHQRGVVDG